MDLVTSIPEAVCPKCKKTTSCLYHGWSQLLCGACRGRLKGTSPVVPRGLCKPPNINWYTKDIMRRKKNCGEHSAVDSNGDSD